MKRAWLEVFILFEGMALCQTIIVLILAALLGSASLTFCLITIGLFQMVVALWMLLAWISYGSRRSHV